MALGKDRVHAIDAGHQPALAAAVGALISETYLPVDPVLVIGWARPVQGIVTHGLPKLPKVRLVRATGGMNQSQSHFQINEFAAAEQMSSPAHLLCAPARPSPDLDAQLMRMPQIARVTRSWERLAGC